MASSLKKTSDRRSEIIKAARKLFQEKEYHKATMQDVMNRLGIAKGTIYHYFKSKEDILEAVIEDIVEENLEKMQTKIQEIKGNALQKLQLLIESGNIAKEQSYLVDHLHKRGNEAMHTRILAATLLKQAQIYAKLIQQGNNEGVFETENPLECAEFILSAVQFLTDLGIYPWAPEDLTRRINALPQLIEQLLKAPKGSFNFIINQLKTIEDTKKRGTDECKR